MIFLRRLLDYIIESSFLTFCVVVIFGFFVLYLSSYAFHFIEPSSLFFVVSFLSLCSIFLLLLFPPWHGGWHASPDFDSSLVEFFIDPSVLVTISGRVLRANGAYRRLLSSGYDRKSDESGGQGGLGGSDLDGERLGYGFRLVGLDVLYTGHTHVSDVIYRLSHAAWRGGIAREVVCLPPSDVVPGAHPDRCVWLRIVAEPILVADRVSYILWRLEDISLDRLEEERSHLYFRTLMQCFDSVPAGIIYVDESGRVLCVNAVLLRWLGLDIASSELRDMSLGDIFPSYALGHIESLLVSDTLRASDIPYVWDLDFPDKRSGSLGVLSVRALLSPSGVLSDSERVFTLILLPRDDVFSALSFSDSEQLSHVSSSDGSDGSDGVSVSDLVPDISSFWSRFVSVFDHAPIGMAEIDSAGRLLSLNAAFRSLLGIGSDDSVGARVLSDFVSPDYRDHVRDGLLRVRPGVWDSVDVDFSGVSRALSPSVVLNGSFSDAGDGSAVRSVRLFFSSFISSVDSPSRFLLLGVDITEHVSLRHQFAQSQKMQAIGHLAGGIAHDFNNVLTAIIGFSDLLLSRMKPTDPSFQDVMNITQNANRAAGLVRQLLAFSRRQTLRPRFHSITDILSNVSHLLGHLLGEHVPLEMTHGRDLGFIRVDETQFEQVLINLAVNARDSMPDGGPLRIETSRISALESRDLGLSALPVGDYVLCTVSDCGTGISGDHLDKIFDPFFTTKAVGEGTGLGLSTAYGIIKQMGGYIFCDSEVDVGTSFKIYLPYFDSSAVGDGVLEEDGSEKAVSGSDLTGEGLILLVEDEDSVRSFASRALSSRGYTVIEARSGDEALDLARVRGSEISLVISDVVMPGMDGPTLYRHFRSLEIGARFIFISGYAEDAFERSLEGDEDFGFLPKPFSLKQLATVVKDAMGGLDA